MKTGLKKTALVMIVSSAAIVAPVVVMAQTGGQPGGPNGSQQAQFRAYQPVLQLVGSIPLLLELDKQKGLAFTKAQAKTLLPILKDLQARADLKPKDASAIQTRIEEKILTDKQLTWMDDTMLKREEERRKRMQNGGGGAPGGNFAGGPPNGAGGARGGPGGGMFQAIQSGKPFNPFKADERMSKPLTDLIALLSKR
jgi:hypothetical protein